MSDMELSVSIHPYIHSPLSKSSIFFNRALALLPVILISVYNYGLMAMLTILTAILAVLLPTYFELKKRGRRFADIGYENYYYAFLYALLLPAGVPLYVAAAGAVIVYLLIFFPPSGTIFRVFNPVSIAIALLTVSFGSKMLYFNYPRPFMSAQWFFPFPFDEYSNGFIFKNATVISDASSTGLQNLIKLLAGWYPGHYCETSIIVILMVAFILYLKRSVDTVSIAGSFSGLFLATAVFTFSRGFWGVVSEFVYHAFGSLFLFYSCFVLTDYYSSPERPFSRFIYGAFFGAMAYMLSFYGGGMDMTNYALLISSSIVPALDETAGWRRS